MTNQEKIRFLRRYRVNGLEIERILDELERLRSMAERCTANASSFPTFGGAGDRIQQAVEKMAEWERKLSVKAWEAIRLREEIEQAIESVKDHRLRLLLRYRYIDGLSFECIAERMNKSLRQVFRWHKKIINVIECHN